MEKVLGVILLLLLFSLIVFIAIKCQESLKTRESFTEKKNNNFVLELKPIV